MPFKKGDVVELKAGRNPGELEYNKKYVVEKYMADGWPLKGGAVLLEGHHNPDDVAFEGCYVADRFKLVEQDPLVFAVGAQVERTAPGTMYTEKGGKYIIKAVTKDALGAITHFTLEGRPGLYGAKNFKVVGNVPKREFNRDGWTPQAGEVVFITGRDMYSNGPKMDKYVNDGVKYVINYISGKRIWLIDHEWMYLKESLTPAWAYEGKKAPPKPKDPEDLREHLFKRLGGNLGHDLCAYAFETKEGMRHFYPYVCHARLNNGHGEITKMVYSFRHDMKRVQAGKEEAHKAYSKYIISESPWKDAFITQDIEEAIAKDIFMNVEVNRFMMAGACVALRTGQEYPDRPVIFKEMLDRGHNPHTCWLISCAFVKNEESYSFNSWGGGHDVIDKYRYMDDVIKFFQQGYHLPKAHTPYYGEIEPCTKDPYRTHHGNYAIACTIAGSKAHGKDHSKSIGAWFEKHTKQSTVGEGWNKKTIIDVKALDDVATKLDKLIKGEA